jgi:hypothetical protein
VEPEKIISDCINIDIVGTPLFEQSLAAASYLKQASAADTSLFYFLRKSPVKVSPSRTYQDTCVPKSFNRALFQTRPHRTASKKRTGNDRA